MATPANRIKAELHVYTGNGGGKTTSALGVAMRALGHNLNVEMVQFMKGRKDIGEFQVQKYFRKFHVYQFGTKEFVNLKNPSDYDKKRAADGLKFAEKIAQKKPFLLILDEVNIAVKFGLLNAEDVIEMLKKVPKQTTVYLTGRYAPEEFVKVANYVVEISDIKRQELRARKGIEY